MFIKTNISLCMVLGNEVEIEKELGYLYKKNLSLVKRGTHSWKLSHEHSGYSVIMLNMPLDLAKQATMLIHTLVDWSETNQDTINLIIRENEETIEILRDLSQISTEEEIEEIRDKLLQKADNNTSISDLIDLMVT